MDAAAIELSEVTWEQFIGAVHRAERLRRLTATARPKRRRRAPATTPRLSWMRLISAAGFALLRSRPTLGR